MKTIKKITFIAFVFALISANLFSQAVSDTTFHYRNKSIQVTDSVDEVKVKVSKNDQSELTPLYEATFVDGQTVETYNVDAKFDIQTPFGSLIERKGKLPMKTHWGGMGIGYAGLIGGESVGFKPSFSWEYNFNFLDMTYFSSKNQLALVTGFGMSVKNYKLGKDRHFVETKDGVIIQTVPAENHYRRNSLVMLELTVPLLLEWQPKLNTKYPLYIQAGLVVPYLRVGNFNTARLDPVNKSEYYDRINARDINSGLDIYAQIGYGKFGIYGKYSPISIFGDDENRNVPDIRQFSVGINWNF